MTEKPTMFIGSSVEGLDLARAAKAELEYDVSATVWNQSIFDISKNTLESLLGAARGFDYGLFVFSPDDLATSRKKQNSVVRDNVLFECGMFFGAMGRDRCFFLVPSGIRNFHIPTDLLGITPASYIPGSHPGNLRAEVGNACEAIRDRIRSTLGVGKPSSLTGEWNQCWHYDGPHYPERNESKAIIKQIGNHFFAEFSATPRDSTHTTKYPMNGIIDNGRYITGIWGNPSNGPTYYGSFQLFVDHEGRRMRGKYIGYGRENHILSNDWEWERQ